ncbi:tRNA lysidine(34) synthetase TilS [Mycoplasma corogypsi]|uniref:tRNA lysidine(34) synthetase TilS n=1 Tax=Mycoplasma corogypsi TaxID=2106 RepID=UPI003872CEF8
MHSTVKNKFLIAVSGGPDSLFLLFKYLKYQPVVAFVNYNQREDSWYDEKLVTDFCQKHKLILETKTLKKSDFKGGNFQDWARTVRYEFFREIYKKYSCTSLLIAHHLDDFLETAILQTNSNRKVRFYGIKSQTKLYGMNIYRPFLYKYFKSTILKKCKKNNITFQTDYTNGTDKYTRNAVRLKNNKLSEFNKYLKILKFRLKNLLLSIKNRKLEKDYTKWQASDFEQNILKTLKNQELLVSKYIFEHFNNINLPSSKQKQIVKFILSNNRTAKYLLKNEVYLFKNKGKLIN